MPSSYEKATTWARQKAAQELIALAAGHLKEHGLRFDTATIAKVFGTTAKEVNEATRGVSPAPLDRIHTWLIRWQRTGYPPMMIYMSPTRVSVAWVGGRGRKQAVALRENMPDIGEEFDEDWEIPDCAVAKKARELRRNEKRRRAAGIPKRAKKAPPKTKTKKKEAPREDSPPEGPEAARRASRGERQQEEREVLTDAARRAPPIGSLSDGAGMHKRKADSEKGAAGPSSPGMSLLERKRQALAEKRKLLHGG